jgi:tetratricopeptide (TPR) repeat protein
VRESLNLYEMAIKLKPDYWAARSNVITALANLGDEEGAWRAGTSMIAAAGGRPGAVNETYYSALDTLTWNLQALRGGMAADLDAAGGIGTSDFSEGALIAQVDVWLHDTSFPFGRCSIARVEESAGHPDKADGLLNDSGSFLECYRARGDILAGRGDWHGAQKIYADGVALAPDLPAGYYSWGVALAKRGDLDGVMAKLKDAHAKGPHWADPLKAWGDALLKQGKTAEALVKYDEALQYAPNWKQLKEAREALTKPKT